LIDGSHFIDIKFAALEGFKDIKIRISSNKLKLIKKIN